MTKKLLLSVIVATSAIWFYGCKKDDAPVVVRMTINDVIGTYSGYLTYEKVDSMGVITFQEQQTDTIKVSRLSDSIVRMESRQMGAIVSNLQLDLATETELPFRVAKQGFKGFADPTGNGLYIISDTLFSPAFHKGSITTAYFNVNEGFVQQKKYARYKIAALLK